MPSFMIVALWGGHEFWNPGLPCRPESMIIPEKPNQSKGLLQTLAIIQVPERTGFFAAKRHFCGPPCVSNRDSAPFSAFCSARPSTALLHAVEELVVVLGGAQLVEQEFGRLELVHAEQQLPQDPHLGQDVRPDQQLLAASAGAV